MNRITASVERMRKQIHDRISLGLMTHDRVEAARRKLDMDVEEYCLFQQKKTLAVADGTLTAEEGQTVFALLGTTVTYFNRQPVEVKSVLNNLFKELLQKDAAGAGR
jgi:hypothetical protein